MKESKARIERKPAIKSGQQPPGILQWAGLNRPATLGLTILLGIVLASGLSVVRTTHQNRFAFNELQELKDQANDLETQWGQLLIEQSTFGVEGRIEQKAIESLQMRLPDLTNVVLVRND